MHERHPNLRFHLGGTRLGLRVADSCAFDAVPHRFFPTGPFPQSVNSLWYVPEILGAVWFLHSGDRIDIERHDVGAANVSGIVVEAGPWPSPFPFIIGDALAEVEQNGTGSVGGLESLII